MSSILLKGIVRNGRVEVAEPINLPDGSEVTITDAGSAAASQPEASAVADGWSVAKNERRCDLIRRKFSQGIDAVETRELAELQEELAAYRKRTVPLPYDVIDAMQTALNASGPSPAPSL